MAKFKVPSFVTIQGEEFLKTSIGKVKKNEIRPACPGFPRVPPDQAFSGETFVISGWTGVVCRFIEGLSVAAIVTDASLGDHKKKTTFGNAAGFHI